jgi:hypothetical protein
MGTVRSLDRSNDRISSVRRAALHQDVRLGYMFIPNTTGANEISIASERRTYEFA